MPEPEPHEQEAPTRTTPIRVTPVVWLIALVLGLYFFSAISTVLLGILAACIIAATLQPLLRYIPVPRGLDVAVVGLGLVAVVAVVGFSLSWPLARPISDAVDNWPATRQEVNVTLEGWSQRIGLPEPLRVERMLKGLGEFLTGGGGQVLFSHGTDVVLGILLSLLFTIIGSIFLLSERQDRLLTPALRLFAARRRPALRAVVADLAPRFRWWVIGTLSGMTVVFVASLVGYKIIGLKFAVPLALIAGFAEIVPTVGPATACAIAALFAGATQGGTTAVGVLVVYGIVQAVEAYFVLPLIMRGAVNMHPAVTLFTVILWGKIFGVAGLMLAIPINLTIWTFLEHLRIRPREREEEPAPSEELSRT